MHQPPAADSSSSALRSLFTPSTTVQYHLGQAAHDRSNTPALYGALLTGKVFTRDFEVILGVEGPLVEFLPTRTDRGESLVLFTSRNRFQRDMNRMDGEAMPFVYVLELLPHGVGLLLDPEHEAFFISPEDIEMLRRIAASESWT
jgi:hypothetical protein